MSGWSANFFDLFEYCNSLKSEIVAIKVGTYSNSVSVNYLIIGVAELCFAFNEGHKPRLSVFFESAIEGKTFLTHWRPLDEVGAGG